MGGTYLIAIILIMSLIFIAGLFRYQSRKKSRIKRNKMQQIYDNTVSKHVLKPDHKEILANKIFAIDLSKKVLFFSYHFDDLKHDAIRLEDVKQCVVKMTGTKTKQIGKAQKAVYEEQIDWVYISIILRNNTTVDIPVYSELYDGVLERVFLTSIADKWKKIINSAITE